jgi:archaeosine synthase beta-subunit
VKLQDPRIRALRPPKPYVDPWKAHGNVVESERRPDGSMERALTVFLAGSECPFTCAFCDLWRFTIDGPTPRGALPRQLREALDECARPLPRRLKLYNASNFFDARAVPTDDWVELASLAGAFDGVTVESHASMVGRATTDFARLLRGRLEVAIGLETVHKSALRQLNKHVDLDRFDRAAAFVAEHDMDLRVFVLLGAPFIPRGDQIEWTLRSVEHAADRGAAVVAIIPVRGGNGELERLQSLGAFTPPTLQDVEDALDRCLDVRSTVVTVDLWDVKRLAACDVCRAARTDRLWRMNRTGDAEPRVVCYHCDGV